MEFSIERNTSFMTHNGLKVRLNHDFCTKNMNEKSIWAWYVSIEAFDSLGSILSIITVIIMMFNSYSLVYVGEITAIMYFLGYFISQSFLSMVLLNMIYGFFYMIYSQIDKFFIPYISLIVISIITKKYYILLCFIIVRIICFIILRILNYIQSTYYMRKYRIYLGDVEITAAKMLKFYSKDNTNFKQWLEEYSAFINAE